MLSSGHAANETFSPSPGAVEGLSRKDASPRFPGPTAEIRGIVAGLHREDDALASAAIRSGDQVVFERLDVAEALGIWRHARGRVVGVHGRDGHGETVDVLFDGHEILERYLPDLFRWVQ